MNKIYYNKKLIGSCTKLNLLDSVISAFTQSKVSGGFKCYTCYHYWQTILNGLLV